jgi:branched-chain amino acid transport system permease protein
MNIVAQQVLNGLTLGSVYALVALGLTLVYGILQIPNFAHGAMFTVGAYVAYFASNALGANYWAAMALAVVFVVALAIVSERLIFRRLRTAPPLLDMIAAIGLMLFLEALVQAIWGADFQRLPAPYPQIVRLFGLAVPAQRLIIIAGCIVLVGAIHLFLKRTMTGAAIIAMAQNREGAALVGINENHISAITFGMSGALAAIAATLFAPINLISPSMGHLMLLKAFVIIILGGMGSIPGAIIGAMIIGFAESLGAFYISTDYKDIIAFVLLVFILSVRPRGLFTQGVR